ncbi:DUF4340 domain-containing protein [Pseudomonas sp. IT-P258]|uniref:hypothetical protein n=1 Tax=Pseudomonas sp. IT-P258 TaxID=3026447 RepID=UPI0039E15A21
MWTPGDTGVFLQRIETPGIDKVIIKLVRKQSDDSADQRSFNLYSNVTTMTLHIKPENIEEYRLDYDPWSDINVTPDRSIDDKDIDAITKLALAFYSQPIIAPGDGAFLSLEPEDLVDIFDPDKPIEPVPPPIIGVQIEVLDMEDSDQPEFDYFMTALSVDNGANFKVRRINPHSGIFYVPGMDDLVKSFIKLKL